MLVSYGEIILLCSIMFILKSLAYGNFIQINIATNHNNKYFKKHKSKNFFVNYFYINYFNEINIIVFIFNILLPIISFVLLVIGSIAVALDVEFLYLIVNCSYAIAVLFTLVSFVFAMIYSWVSSKNRIISIILAIVLILLPIFYLFMM